MMKKFIFIAVSLIFCSQFSYAKTTPAKPEPKVTKVDEKKIEDVKTFDFDRIFSETETYYQAAKSWEKIRCAAKSGFVCTKRECPKLKLVDDAHIILDRKSEIISLCKDKVCKYYPATFEQTGVFVTVRVVESDGIFIRVLGDSRFKEISMVGLDAYISNGECVQEK